MNYYGIMLNKKGLTELNYLYTEEDLLRLQKTNEDLSDFTAGCDEFYGAFYGNVTFIGMKLNRETEEETLENIKKFLTGGYNMPDAEDDEIIVDWTWEVEKVCLFNDPSNGLEAGYNYNPTTIEFIERLNLCDDDMRGDEFCSDSTPIWEITVYGDEYEGTIIENNIYLSFDKALEAFVELRYPYMEMISHRYGDTDGTFWETVMTTLADYDESEKLTREDLLNGDLAQIYHKPISIGDIGDDVYAVVRSNGKATCLCGCGEVFAKDEFETVKIFGKFKIEGV